MPTLELTVADEAVHVGIDDVKVGDFYVMGKWKSWILSFVYNFVVASPHRRMLPLPMLWLQEGIPFEAALLAEPFFVCF